MGHMLALNQGTTDFRGISLRQADRSRHAARREISRTYPNPSWREGDSSDISTSRLLRAKDSIFKGQIEPDHGDAAEITPRWKTTSIWVRNAPGPINLATFGPDRKTAALRSHESLAPNRQAKRRSSPSMEQANRKRCQPSRNDAWQCSRSFP